MFEHVVAASNCSWEQGIQLFIVSACNKSELHLNGAHFSITGALTVTVRTQSLSMGIIAMPYFLLKLEESLLMFV